MPLSFFADGVSLFFFRLLNRVIGRRVTANKNISRTDI
jgi:hypothetical protein